MNRPRNSAEVLQNCNTSRKTTASQNNHFNNGTDRLQVIAKSVYGMIQKSGRSSEPGKRRLTGDLRLLVLDACFSTCRVQYFSSLWRAPTAEKRTRHRSLTRRVVNSRKWAGSGGSFLCFLSGLLLHPSKVPLVPDKHRASVELRLWYQPEDSVKCDWSNWISMPRASKLSAS